MVQFPMHGEVYLVLPVDDCLTCGEYIEGVVYDMVVPKRGGGATWALICGRCYSRRASVGQVRLGVGHGQRYECVEMDGHERWRLSAGGGVAK